MTHYVCAARGLQAHYGWHATPGRLHQTGSRLVVVSTPPPPQTGAERSGYRSGVLSSHGLHVCRARKSFLGMLSGCLKHLLVSFYLDMDLETRLQMMLNGRGRGQLTEVLIGGQVII